METKSKKVFVGLSGGVDSAVAALRLQKSGYDVVGVFIKVWQPDFLECNWEQERLDAMRVAAHLGIPFLTCDAAERYKIEVGDYFVSEYKAGRTPNPDVLCNQSIKFGAFLEFARAYDADYIATGHYVRTEEIDASFRLLRGIDRNKDQSYFLWTLTQEQLARSLFPIGVSTKDTIRDEAKKANIPTAVKKDSQGICFLGHIDIPSFMSHFIELQEGAVLDEEGNEIGRHSGALVYTIGQRHGFSIQTHEAQRMPQYVVAKDISQNTITVAPSVPKVMPRTHIRLEKTNWILHVPQAGEYAEAQFRYRQTPFKVRVAECDSATVTLELMENVDRPAIGQSCVLYTGDECLGGGIISES